MTTELLPTYETEHRPTDLQQVIVSSWDKISKLRAAPLDDPSGSVENETALLSADIMNALQNEELTTPEFGGNKTYHELKFMLNALPALINVPRHEILDDNSRRHYAGQLREAAIQTCADILDYFSTGAWYKEQGALIGLLNEVTPIGVYTTDKHLLMRGTIDEDLTQKTDIMTYNFDVDGRAQETIRVQCKSSLYSSPPEKGIVFLSARDFGNKQDIRRDIRHDSDMSRLLVDARNGLISEDEAHYISTVASQWDDLVIERLSARYRLEHSRKHESFRKHVQSLIPIQHMISQQLVPRAGLEPARAKSSQDFESGVSTNSTTAARVVKK